MFVKAILYGKKLKIKIDVCPVNIASFVINVSSLRLHFYIFDQENA